MRSAIAFFVGFSFGWLAIGVREAARKYRAFVRSQYARHTATFYDQEEES